MKEGSDVYTLTLRHRTRFEGVESRGQDIESLEVVPRELNSVFQLKLKSKNWVIISVGTYISSSK